MFLALLAVLTAISVRAAPVRIPAVAASLNPGAHVVLAGAAPGLTRIAVFGDAGTRLPGQYEISRALLAEHKLAPFASALVLGDNVYNKGEVENFDASIRDAYSELFGSGVRFFPVLGNHDVRTGGGEQQREYWGAPRWYSTAIGEVDVFALDTTVLLHDLPDMKRSYAGREAELAELKRLQLEWLEQALSKSTAKHKVVFGHHPFYVSTSAKEPPKVVEAERMRELLEPVLKKHGVGLYLAGHQHHYERSTPQGGVTHVTSGAGGQLDDRPLFYHSGVASVLEKTRHFLILEVEGDVLRVKAQAADGRVIDEFTLGAPGA